MKAFFQCCAGVVIASTVLALLACGSMMGISVVGIPDGGVALTCVDHTCTPVPQDCLFSCLAGTDELEARMLLSVAVLVTIAVATIFVPVLQVSPEFIRISAPPWRQHRLFVFRE